jgi:D-sedoheptulose 7-phosphate isomerase
MTLLPFEHEIMAAMDMTSHMTSHFNDAVDALKASAKELAGPLSDAVDLVFASLANDGKILACGNGGSAADAQHFIAELVGRFERDRLPLAGIALNTDTSIMTAVGNDYGFDAIFERQVYALGHTGDVLVAISTSGNSPNVVRSIEAAHERDMSVIALTGKGGGRISEILNTGDIHLCVPQDRTMRIQEVHIVLLHALCDGIDALLLGDTL